MWTSLHSKKRTTCSGLMKTALNNVLLPTLFKVVDNIVQHCYTWLQANSGSSTCSVLLTTLNNVCSKTLFNAVFIRPEQVVRFLLCTIWGIQVYIWYKFTQCIIFRPSCTADSSKVWRFFQLKPNGNSKWVLLEICKIITIFWFNFEYFLAVARFAFILHVTHIQNKQWSPDISGVKNGLTDYLVSNNKSSL